MVASFVFYFRRNHYIVEEISDYLKMMHANGFINFVQKKYGDARFLKKEEDTGHPKIMELVHLYGAFKIYLMCNFIAFVVFVFEVLTKKFFLFKN